MRIFSVLLLGVASMTTVCASDFVGDRCPAFSKWAKDADFIKRYYTAPQDKLDKRTHLFRLTKEVKSIQMGYEEEDSFLSTEKYTFTKEGYLKEVESMASTMKGVWTYRYVFDTINQVTVVDIPKMGSAAARTCKYDKNGECVEIRVNGKVTFSRRFDEEGRIVSLLDMKAGEKDTFFYEPGQPIVCKRIRKGKDLTLPALKPIKYDRFGNEISESGQGCSYKLHPDGRVRMRSMQNPRNYTEQVYEYDEKGNLVTYTEKSSGMESGKIVYVYDAKGRVLSVTHSSRGKETSKEEYIYSGDVLKSVKVYDSGDLRYEEDLDAYGNPLIKDDKAWKYEYFK